MYKLAFVFMLCVSSLFGGIQGFWKSINETTGQPQCIVAVYEYKGFWYGRIIATFDELGKVKEDIYKPKERAPGVVGNPFYCGLDIIWDLQNQGSNYKGKILDPQKGNIYKAQLWTEGGYLFVRGKWGLLGRTQAWLPVEDSDFPKNFKKPALDSLVPAIPTVND